jgi:isocitrate lyase
VKIAIDKSSALAPGAKASAFKHYLEASDSKSNTEARDIAADILGERIRWDWDCT